MVVCNSCRYCEGLCAVFPAMETRRIFSDKDLNYLANLCHGCGACYDDCQFSPPHEFNVNVPRTLAIVRNDAYRAYAWPRALGRLFARNGLAVTVIAALSVAAFILCCVMLLDPTTFGGRHTGPGAFYALVPHEGMVLLFGSMFTAAVAAIVVGAREFAHEGGTLSRASLWRASKDAGNLRYLGGGKGGCRSEEQRGADTRRGFHHLTLYGFLLCFAATCTATVYHYALGREAPYPWYDVPVLLGMLGGLGLLVGPVGLLFARFRRPAHYRDESRGGMDVAFLAILFLASLSGLALLMLRATALMGLVLAVHLGLVFAFFVTLPYGKFVHGIYRYLALARYAQERRAVSPSVDQS